MFPEDFDQIETATTKAAAYIRKARVEAAKGWTGQALDSLEAAQALLEEASHTMSVLINAPAG